MNAGKVREIAPGVTVELVEPGELLEYRAKSGKKTVRINRVYRCMVDGHQAGFIRYMMLTRERSTPGKRYVNSRWSSPGWAADENLHGRAFECDSLKHGAERTARDHRRGWEKA